MKKIICTFLLLCIAATTLSAQTIVKGDMNDDNEVTIADVISLVNVVLGKSPLETISAGCSCEPYKVDNSLVVGSWSTPDGTSFQFNEDGTTTFPGGATYEFMPMLGRLLVYDAENQPVKAIPVLKVESEKILTVDYATNTFTYFTKDTPAETYYWYVGTSSTEPNESNYQTILTQVDENDNPYTFTNTNVRHYMYIVVRDTKSVTSIKDGQFNTGYGEYSNITIPGYKVYRSNSAISLNHPLVITIE